MGLGIVARADGPLRKRALQSLMVIAAAFTALTTAFGGMGVVVAAILSFVWLAWRFDNQSGTFLALAVLLLIVIAIPALLLVLMAVTH